MRASDVINKLNLGTSKQVLSAQQSSPLNILVTGLHQEIIDMLHGRMDKYDISASNRLKQSIVTLDDSKAGVISVNIQANFYWKYVNYGVNGTKKNWGAPTWGPAPSGTASFKQNILDWIKDRGLKARPGQTYEQMAFAIMRGLKENGMEPRPFVTEVVNKELAAFLEKQISQVYAAAILIEIKGSWQ